MPLFRSCDDVRSRMQSEFAVHPQTTYKEFDVLELKTRNRLNLKWMSCCMVAGLCLAPLLARADEPSERVERAAQVFKDLSNADSGLPINVLNKADCVIILPSVKKAGFIVGAQYGKGVMVCR